MYNRYTREPDGSYRRSRIAEPPSQHPTPPPPQENKCDPPLSLPLPPDPPVRRPAVPSRPMPSRPRKPQEPVSVGHFLKQLLPKNFDTEDLLIVVLLLLMSGDCREDQNTALLTLVLYLFM